MSDNAIRPRTTGGPITHILVEQERLDQHLNVLREKLLDGPGGFLRLAADDMSDWMRNAITDAYRAGLRDGFAQGAIAEALTVADDD